MRPPSERLRVALRFGAEDEDFLGLSALKSTLLSGVDSDFNLHPVYRPHPWAGDSWGPPFRPSRVGSRKEGPVLGIPLRACVHTPS